MKVTYSKPLVNPFKGRVCSFKDKLDELYNYFVGLVYKGIIIKAHKEEPESIFVMDFWYVMDVSVTCMFFYLILLKVVINVYSFIGVATFLD